jgi:hypothetical protein
LTRGTDRHRGSRKRRGCRAIDGRRTPRCTSIPAASGSDRSYDLLVLRHNRSAGSAAAVVQPVVITGTPAASPSPPSISGRIERYRIAQSGSLKSGRHAYRAARYAPVPWRDGQAVYCRAASPGMLSPEWLPIRPIPTRSCGLTGQSGSSASLLRL